jgi:hypothetical protein
MTCTGMSSKYQTVLAFLLKKLLVKETHVKLKTGLHEKN